MSTSPDHQVAEVAAQGFRIRIDGESCVVQNAAPTGTELLALVDKTVAEWCLFQVLPGGTREHVEASERVDLADRGVERFDTDRAAQLSIEGRCFPWCMDTITTEQIAQLGGWDPAVGVIAIDKDNNERTLAPREVVELKHGHGHGFGKKVKWKRG